MFIRRKESVIARSKAEIEAEKKKGDRGRERKKKRISLEANLIFFQSIRAIH